MLAAVFSWSGARPGRHYVVYERLGEDQHYDCDHAHNYGHQIHQRGRKPPGSLAVTPVDLIRQHRHESYAQSAGRQREEKEIRQVESREVGVRAVRAADREVAVNQLSAQEA